MKSNNKNIINLGVKKLHPDALLPIYATEGAACFDLHAYMPEGEQVNLTRKVSIDGVHRHTFSTGLAFEIPDGYQIMIFSRSGHGFNHDSRLSNCVGIIDQDYKGEVKVRLSVDYPTKDLIIKHGDRIAQAQLVPVTKAAFHEVSELSDSERGTGGFGSTGH